MMMSPILWKGLVAVVGDSEPDSETETEGRSCNDIVLRAVTGRRHNFLTRLADSEGLDDVAVAVAMIDVIRTTASSRGGSKTNINDEEDMPSRDGPTQLHHIRLLVFIRNCSQLVGLDLMKIPITTEFDTILMGGIVL